MSREFDLVTGGAGFIGSHLAEGLIERGRRIIVLDNFSSGKIENIKGLINRFRGKIELVEGDIRDQSLCAGLAGRSEVIYHLAAIPSVQYSVDFPIEVNSVNVEGTLSVFQAARKEGVKTVVFASSCAVYGDSENLPLSEAEPPRPMSPYAISKLTDEAYSGVFSEVYGFSSTALRFFNVFGPRQDPSSDYAAVIPRFVTRMLAGKPPIIYGDGEQSRDFIYVENVVAANMAAAAAAGQGICVNIGTGRGTTLNQVVGILNSILNTDFEPDYQEARAGDIKYSEARVKAAEELIGFKPAIDFEEGLRRTVESFKRNL
ncbi:MAG: NAD-dependent epimerase/dehydratase family protein [Acidobacteriota bacterium]